jgi:hypothetical protein
VALSLQSLAVVLRAQVRLQEAAQVLAVCVTTRERLLGKDSPQLAAAYHQQVRRRAAAAATGTCSLACQQPAPTCTARGSRVHSPAPQGAERRALARSTPTQHSTGTHLASPPTHPSHPSHPTPPHCRRC